LEQSLGAVNPNILNAQFGKHAVDGCRAADVGHKDVGGGVVTLADHVREEFAQGELSGSGFFNDIGDRTVGDAQLRGGDVKSVVQRELATIHFPQDGHGDGKLEDTVQVEGLFAAVGDERTTLQVEHGDAELATRGGFDGSETLFKSLGRRSDRQRHYQTNYEKRMA
jgi:hypothetical protein